tara:strand:+ start:102 stop:779 length:678 start_codon:yes stop_codon:yes gene_type:complete
MNELQKMLAKMFPQSEQSINERAYTLAYGEDPRDREDYDPRIGYDFFTGEQFNIADVIREANLSPEEYDKFIDLVKENELSLLSIGRDPDEVAEIFSRIYNPDNRTSNTKRRMPKGFDQGFGNFRILAEVLAGRESSPSLEKSPRSKSIDDILRESDVAEFLSKAGRDATNVDVTRQKNVESATLENILKMFGQIRFENMDSNIGRMDRQTLQEILNMREPIPPR